MERESDLYLDEFYKATSDNNIRQISSSFGSNEDDNDSRLEDNNLEIIDIDDKPGDDSPTRDNYYETSTSAKNSVDLNNISSFSFKNGKDSEEEAEAEEGQESNSNLNLNGENKLFHVTNSGDIINHIEDDFPLILNQEPEHNSEKEDSDYFSTSDESDDDEKFKNVVIVKEHALNEEDIKKGLEKPGKTPGGHYTFTHLNVSSHGLIDIQMIEPFNLLKSVDISRNYIKDVKILGSLKYLESIDASRNEMSTFLDMKPPIVLKEVNFSRNKISEILDLKEFWALTEINLSHNQIKNVNGFKECKHLRLLDLSHNQISEIQQLECPNLIVLLLNKNMLTHLRGIENCGNLRYLNVSRNDISSLEQVRSLFNLIELKIRHNNISDLNELDSLKLLLNLRTLAIRKNPVSELGMYRLMLIDTLPRLMEIDESEVKVSEKLEAKNIFTPSFTKLAHLDHTQVMLEKSRQPATKLFTEHSLIYPIPPILLLVGAQHSELDKMAFLLKKTFHNKVQFGGVYSTSTKMEGEKDDIDIPISYETFLDMRKNGEFLTTSHTLGRDCGFASSQIAKAAEKKAVLIATISLVSAICLRKWLLNPAIVLVSPSCPPHLLDDEKKRSFIEQGSSNDIPDEEIHHKQTVSFNQEPDPEAHSEAPKRRHSILKEPSFELDGIEKSNKMRNGPGEPQKTVESQVFSIEGSENDEEIVDNKESLSLSLTNLKQYELQMENLEEVPDNPEAGHESKVESKKVNRVSSLILRDVNQVLTVRKTSLVENILMDLPDKIKLEEKERAKSASGRKSLVKIKRQLPGVKSIDSKTLFGISDKVINANAKQNGNDNDLEQKVQTETEYEGTEEEEELETQNPNTTDTNDSGIEIKPGRKVADSHGPTENIIQSEENGAVQLLKKSIEESGNFHLLSPSDLEAFNQNQEKLITLDQDESINSFDSQGVKENLKKIESTTSLGALSNLDDKSSSKVQFKAFFGNVSGGGEDQELEEAASKQFQSLEVHDHRFRNHDAMVTSIMKTRKIYDKYHQRNPGFFMDVIDPCQPQEAERRLIKIVQKLIASYETAAGAGSRKDQSNYTHEGENQEEGSIFKDAKLKELKDASISYSKGYENSVQHLKGTCEEEIRVYECDKIFFEKKLIPKNLLEPTRDKPIYVKKNARKLSYY